MRFGNSSPYGVLYYLTVSFRFLLRKKGFVARKKQATPEAFTKTTVQKAAE